MRIIRNLIDHRRVWRSLNDYPVYSPPFHDAEIVLTPEQIEANYDYFLKQKSIRLDYLAKYLAAFSVELRLAQEALPALDRWLYRYGGHLIPSGGEVISALADYEPAWVGNYHGLNIVNDIAIFAGDYIISRNRDARWDVWYGDGTKYDYEKEGFGQPCLFGLCHFGYEGHYSMLNQVFECCSAGRSRLHRGKSVVLEWDIPGELVRVLNHLANPNPPPSIPFSQLTIDD